MDPCVTCGTTEETTSVCTCDCQCLETARRSGCREIKLIAPTRDTATAWTENDPIVPEGVFFLVKDRLFEGSLEYAIGDGESKYSELSMLYAGAPLSRTGAQNHSPLAASGKSTLDPSWLPAATNSTLGAVMASTTGAAGKVPIPASGSSTLDSSWLPVSTSGAANKIPIADNNGKLDPSWLPEATSTTLGGVKASTTTAADCVVKADANGSLDGWKDAIASALENESGGLVTDSSGNLMVDFSQMPTDKFEALLKGLKMLIPLTSNLNLYVDTNSAAAGDTIIDGRGTEGKPFKTIQACVNYATSTYSIGSRTLYIRVKAGTYNEAVSLPEYTYGSGVIRIIADSGEQDVIIEAPLNEAGTRLCCLTANGGKWRIENITAKRVENPTTTTGGVSTGCFHATGASTFMYLYGVKALQSLPDNPSVLSSSATYYTRIIHADQGAQIRIYPSENQSVISAAKNSGTTPYISVLSAARGANITFVNTTNADLETAVACSGSCDYFLNLSTRSVVNDLGGGTHISFTGTMTGQKYLITGASCTNVTGGDTDFFPGSSAGSVDTDTYCYYA